MNSSFKVETDDCLMCNNQVLKKIGELRGVFGADIDYIKNIVNVQHTDEVSREEIEEVLKELKLINQCEL